MNSHLRHDLEKLKDRLLTLAASVEENLRLSVKALNALSEELAQTVIKNDISVDKMEVEMEEECLKVLALHQPVASDLRFVVTVLKINNELEHIGDMAANIAHRIGFIKHDSSAFDIPFDLPLMTTKTISMLKNSIDAFMCGNEYLALDVCNSDEEIDAIMRQCYIRVEKLVSESCGMNCVNYLLICKSMERIADLCTNIAEDVIYMRHSIIVRHNLKDALKTIKSEE